MDYPVRLVKDGASIDVYSPQAYQQKLWEGWQPATAQPSTAGEGRYVTRGELDIILREIVLGNFDLSAYITDAELIQAFDGPSFAVAVRNIIERAVASGAGLRTSTDLNEFQLSTASTGAQVEDIDAVPGLRDALNEKADEVHEHTLSQISDFGSVGLEVAKTSTRTSARDAINAAEDTLVQSYQTLLAEVQALRNEVAALQAGGGDGGGSTPPPSTPTGFGNEFGNNFGGSV